MAERLTMDATALEQAATYDDWVRIIARHLDAHDLHYGHGTGNSGDEAFWLLRHLQDWRDDAWAETPDRRLIAPAVELAERRAKTHIPLAYLLGEAWFAGLRFKVDPRVLIPRSPLAELLENRLLPWCRLRPGDRVLDVGTGSGCIAIAAAHHCESVLVDATESDPAALELARENVERHGLSGRVRVLEADLFPRSRPRYRVIISNPPYVPADVLASLPAEYGYEPAQALAGGADGLDATRRLLAGAARRLTADGVLIVEVGEAAEALVAAYPRLPFVWVELERGGDGIFVVTAEDLAAMQ